MEGLQRRWLATGLIAIALCAIPLGVWAGQQIPATDAPAQPVASDSKLQGVLNKKFPNTAADLKTIQQRVQKVLKKVLPCTVGVRIGPAQGSGVIISKDGYVLTAGHVSGRPGQTAVIIFPDGRQVKGRTLGANRSIDSGMVKITDEGPWPFAEMAAADEVDLGQWCLTTGHPGGFIQGRTPVVRLGRVLACSQRVICTDCTLVGGDSGGPLFDLDGKVIGIHSRIGRRITMNYHVPIATYHETWDRLASGELWGSGRSGERSADQRPLLGISGNPRVEPCTVNQVVPESPAAKAGIQLGDIVQTFDNQHVANFAELAKMLEIKKAGDKVPLEVRRGKETLVLEIELAYFNLPSLAAPKS